jgi:hypothetical protein
MKILLISIFLSCLFWSDNGRAIESLDGFLITAFDDRYKVVSPQKFKNKMEVIVENKTLIKLIGKIVLNNSKNIAYYSIPPENYQKVIVDLKVGDIIHFYPMSPAFQEVELIVGNKNYEVPPKK